MKKIFIAYAALLLLVIILAFVKFRGGSFFPDFSGPHATIDNHKFDLMIAKTEKEKMVGLSKRKSMNDNQAMLFPFDKKARYSFWMKDTEFALDMIYISDNTIVDIIKNAPPQAGNNGQLPIYTPKTDANYVLEIKGGFSDKYKFKEGDKVTFENYQKK